ncbi:MAG TPA: hypothetical protein VLA45_08245 [Paracoccaceae bacterium]|nr:hypothetical protein [Paracoccaceae bacterium]
MVPFRSKFSLAAVVLAATSMTAAPLAAAELPRRAGDVPMAYDSHAEDAFGYRRYRHSRNHISTGEVIAGVAVIGVLAAIAGSVSENNDRVHSRPEPYREPYREPSRQSQDRARGWNGNGINGAVDMCVSQVERGRDRVGSVDNAARDSSGWTVSGSLENGDYFNCRIDNEGRIRSIDMGDGFAARDISDVGQGRQLSDETYARARSSLGTAPRQAVDDEYGSNAGSGPQPAYPGGPLPGEEGYDESFGG